MSKQKSNKRTTIAKKKARLMRISYHEHREAVDMAQEKRLSKSMAKFQYDHMHLQYQGVRPYAVTAHNDNLLDRDDLIPTHPVKSYLLSKFYFSDAC